MKNERLEIESFEERENYMSNSQLSNVYFYYTRIQDPIDGYKTTDPLKKKYQTTVVLSKDQYNEFKKKYPKNAGKGPIEADEFEKEFKTPVPAEFAGQALIYFLKLDVKAFKFDKETEQAVPMADMYRPRVYQNIDGKQVDVTMDKLVGNGSKGHLNYYEYKYTYEGTEGVAPRLGAILVTDLVEYERKDNPVANAHKF